MKTISCIDHYGIAHDIPIEKIGMRVSGIGVLKDNNTFLMVQDGWAKKWEFPGGGIKIGETVTEAIQREFIEETGLEVEVGKFIDMQEDYYYSEDKDQAWQNIRLYFWVTKVGGSIKATGNGYDSIDVQFISFKDLNPQNTKAPIYQFIKSL